MQRSFAMMTCGNSFWISSLSAIMAKMEKASRRVFSGAAVCLDKNIFRGISSGQARIPSDGVYHARAEVSSKFKWTTVRFPWFKCSQKFAHCQAALALFSESGKTKHGPDFSPTRWARFLFHLD